MIKSEIGHIIHEIAHNKQLKGSDRMKLQRQLAIALHSTNKAEIELIPGIYQDASATYELCPPRFEEEFGLIRYWSICWLQQVQDLFKRIEFKRRQKQMELELTKYFSQ